MVSPEGWLADPEGRWLLLFHKDPMSAQRRPIFYMDKWKVSDIGIPNAFVDRRKVHQGPAKETWNELIQNGWKKVEHQSGEST